VDANNNLLKGYNKYSDKNFNFYQVTFYPDSFFYRYDSCGNCVEETWFERGDKSSSVHNLSYFSAGRQLIIDNESYPDELRIFNSANQLIEISNEDERIVISYTPAKKIKTYQYEDLKESYYKHESSPFLFKITTAYFYDATNRLIKTQERRLNKTDNTMKEKWTVLAWYPNGLPRKDIVGNSITYTY
jgi:hypothetical protein